MRRRRCSVAALCAIVLVAASADSLRGQAGLVTEGGAFLLIPVGARSLGMGQAVVAEQPGTEAVWWNPSALARSERREVAVHHYQTLVGKGNAVSFLYPSAKLGVLTASIYILDYGSDPTTDPSGNPLGEVGARNLVYAVTYSAAVGQRFNAGLTFKVVQFRVECSGPCTGVPTTSASTSAVDVGAQYDFAPRWPLTVGVALRHFGLRLQVEDREQADPLPTRIELGVLYRVVQVERYAPETALHLALSVVDEPAIDAPAARVGAQLGYRARAFLRGGYVFRSAEATGPTIGVGLSTGRLFLDLARNFESFSRSTGQTPVYVSLRYLF